MSTNPQKPPDDEHGGYHSTAEARAAIEALSDDDFRKLELVAGYFHKNRPIRASYGPDDLIQEAVVRTLSGDRRWRHGIEIIKHLDRCMESIAGNPKLRDQVVHTELDAAVNHGAPLCIEQKLIAKDELEAIRSWFAGDQPALDVLALRAEGCKQSEIQHELGIGAKEYDTIRVRIRRTFAKQTTAKGGRQ